MQPQIVHLAGRGTDRLLPELLALLSSQRAVVLDLSQQTLGNTLTFSVKLGGANAATVSKALADFAQRGDLSCAVVTGEEQPPGDAACGVCVTLLGDLHNANPLAEVLSVLERRGMGVRQTRSLGGESLRGVELYAQRKTGGRFPDPELRDLRSELLALGSGLGCDLAVQRDDFYRRSKRLLCMDVDSTFVKGEFIDELAELAGVKRQVAEITASAMRGELDFKGALRERVKLLRGLPMSRALELCDRFELSPGGHDLVRTGKQLGLRIGLVSGGFDFFVQRLKQQFELDFAFANQLEVENGVLTGNVVGTIVDSERKAQVLRDMAHVYGIHLQQTIAVGDGANDILMLEAAGLGIAYQAKPRLREIAHAHFSHHDRLDTLFYLMGFDVPEVTSACR
ncbi:MAG TPA: phosphoserine phosphatase SerB [Polyangiaceae bacterium]|nr:phosphoserine phosphatase SerB [Polyangiaceae bacterium]